MGGLKRYLELKAKEKTGLNAAVLALAGVAALGSVTTFIFLCVAAFVWVEFNHGGVAAGLVLSGFFLVVTIGAVVGFVSLRGSNANEARAELARRPALLHPQLVRSGLQIIQSIGLRRLAPALAAGALAAGLAMEWRKSVARNGREDQKR
jgi:hypothetical protein